MDDEQKKKTIINHIKQRINDANLKPEEIKAIDKARSQVFTQTMAGGFLGSIGIFMLGKRRRLNPFLMIPFVGGGFMLGSQLGMVSGIMAGKRTIEKLPDQTRLINLVKDIQ
ncbi:MAG: hypothetical protein EXX96DRAFT_566696 [Benjaminiella poitrasii]|nr:MAG: hypothetical protein EXX96DRAFT_566696 [Benjaminiella poitrasii]